MLSIEDMARDSQRMPASACVGRTFRQGQRASQKVRWRERGFGDGRRENTYVIILIIDERRV
jgi:hypothetical protein